jgi:hypothetical protein
MANLEKHKKSLVSEWLEEEESTVPTHSRSTHVLGSYIKIPKPVTKKFRPNIPDQKPPERDVSLAREPGPPPKLSTKHSQLASWEHQKRLERLPKLRAPYQYKSR